MLSLNIHRLRAKNMLCFGPEGIDIDFEHMDRIIMVHGTNLDNPSSDGHKASNGAGKSSIQELLSIGFYGRTIKNPTKLHGKDFLNEKATDGEIEIEWNDRRLVRAFHRTKSGSVTSTLKLWKHPDRVWSEKSNARGEKGDTTEDLQEAIGLTHQSFCNIVVFDDRNLYSFLESDAEDKRKIVENLLDLAQYREYHNNAKKLLSMAKERVATLAGMYSSACTNCDAWQTRLVGLQKQEVVWKQKCESDIGILNSTIVRKQAVLVQTDTGEQLASWNNAQNQILTLSDEVTEMESKKTKMLEVINIASERLEQAKNERNSINETIQQKHSTLKGIQRDLDSAMTLISKLENLKEGTPCPVCHGIINAKNYDHVLSHGRQQTHDCQSSMDKASSEIEVSREAFSKKSTMIKTIEDKLKEARNKVVLFDERIRNNRTTVAGLSKLKKPESNTNEQVIEAEITSLRQQIKAKTDEMNGPSPYKELIDQAKTEGASLEQMKVEKESELNAAESEVPYWSYWVDAFGDKGIRKFVIDGIIPTLNNRVAYWLDVLIDGKLEVTFNNLLADTVSRNGNLTRHEKLSNGEMRRINLGVSQAFSYITMLNSSYCPNLLFLDEVTGGGIDRAGVPYVYKMILELAKERQVIVTTHNENLINLMQGCDVIRLRKQDDITVRE